mmetsp:Transcript_15800/g.39381  ORF Transcript_15800/g.39381 Transcript_15800/m.39381 type:complete len:216 (+) Transcript_15800:714-1361(+)
MTRPTSPTMASRSCTSCLLTRPRLTRPPPCLCPRTGRCTTCSGPLLATTSSQWLASCLPRPRCGTPTASPSLTLGRAPTTLCAGTPLAGSSLWLALATCLATSCFGTSSRVGHASRWAPLAAQLSLRAGRLTVARCWWPPLHPACAWTTPSRPSHTTASRHRQCPTMSCSRHPGCLHQRAPTQTGHSPLSASHQPAPAVARLAGNRLWLRLQPSL